MPINHMNQETKSKQSDYQPSLLEADITETDHCHQPAVAILKLEAIIPASNVH